MVKAGIGLREFAGIMCAVALLLCGCSPRVAVQLRLNPGETHTVTVTQDLQQTMSVGGGQQTFPQKGRTVYEMKVEQVGADGTATVKVTYKSAQLPGMGSLAGMEGLGPMSEMLGELGEFSMEGKSFTMQVTPAGRITSVTGMDAIASELADHTLKAMDKVLQELGDQLPIQAKAQLAAQRSKMEVAMRKTMREQVGDQTFKEMLEGMFPAYPSERVKVGEAWTRTRSTTKGAPMTSSENWTLRERTDGVLKMDFTAQVTPNTAAPPFEIMGMTMTTSLSGEMSGSFELDETTGWPQKGSVTRKLQGETKMGGMSFTMSTEGTEWTESTI